jgi:hypothetical protein
MGTFYSSVDETLIEQVMGPRDIFLFIVSSEGKHQIRLEIRNPYNMSIDKMDYSVEPNKKVSIEMEKEIKKKLTERTYAVSKVVREYNGYGWQSKLNDNFYDNLPVEKINQKKRFDLDDEIRDRIKSMMRYNDMDKTVVVCNVPYYYSNELATEFQDYNPEMTSENWEMYTIKFSPKNKEKAIDLMKDLRGYLRNILSEELNCNLDLDGRY